MKRTPTVDEEREMENIIYIGKHGGYLPPGKAEYYFKQFPEDYDRISKMVYNRIMKEMNPLYEEKQ